MAEEAEGAHEKEELPDTANMTLYFGLGIAVALAVVVLAGFLREQ